MNRRLFLLGALTLGAAACTPAALDAAPPFEPTRFSVEVRGRGPDVILIPGLTSAPDIWAGAVAAIPGYRYHLVHVAGFAGAPVRGNADGPVVAPLAEELARYIADRGLERPSIVGHSMGGILAMMIGARHPDLVGRLMVVDMLPQPAGLFGGSASNFGPLAGRIREMMGTAGGSRLFGALVTAFSPPESGGRRSDADMVGRTMHDLAAMDLGPQLGRLRSPMTIVYGSSDPQGRAALDRTFAAAYARARGARLVRIDRSGHMVMLDQPARFQAALRTFLGG